MTSEDRGYFQRSFAEIFTKLDNIYSLVVLIGNEVGVQRGSRLADQVTQILDSVRDMTRDLNASQVKSMPDRMSEVVKTIEFINHKIH